MTDIRRSDGLGGRPVVLVPVAGVEVPTLRQDDVVYVLMRPTCEAIGINWSYERRRVSADPVLGKAVVKFTTAFSKGQKQLCLPLSFFHGWLFRQNLNTLNERARPIIEALQVEGYAVLDAYWRGGVAVNPRIHTVPDDEPWNRASEGTSFGRRFAEERERWEREHGRPLIGVAGFTKQKLRAIEEFDGAIDRGETQRILQSLGFDLRYVFFAERTLTSAERAIRDAYRLGTDDDRTALRRHAEAVRITRTDRGYVAAPSDPLRYAGADSAYYLDETLS